MLRLRKDHARRFLVARHALSPPRALASIDEVVARLGSLQVDPLAVTGLRNHDLVLAARLADYAPALLERALYEDRSLVELYDKCLCVVPMRDLAFHAGEWRRARASIRDRGGAYDDAVRRFGPAILRRLDREGPLSSRELARAGVKVRAGWGEETEARAALYVLVRTGRVLTVRREGNVRFYDRTERVAPPSALAERIDDATSVRHRLLGRFRAMGLLSLSPTAEVFTSTTKARERARIVAELVAERTLAAVDVEGVGPRFVLASELALLDETARGGRTEDEAALLAPLDPMIWDRTLLEPLFGVAYKWGVYTPAHQRQGGYYDLPIVLGDRIVGVIEPVFSRTERTLRIARVELARKIPRAPLERAVAAHARAIGARDIVWDRVLTSPAA